MSDVINYIFSNMKKLDNDQDKIISAVNKCKRNNMLLGKTTLLLSIHVMICALALSKNILDITILNRKIEELEKRLDEYTYSNKEV